MGRMRQLVGHQQRGLLAERHALGQEQLRGRIPEVVMLPWVLPMARLWKPEVVGVTKTPGPLSRAGRACQVRSTGWTTAVDGAEPTPDTNGNAREPPARAA